MRIVLDIDELLRDGRVTPEEYERLKGLARDTSLSLALNILLGFGIVAVAAGAVAYFHSAAFAIGLGAALAVVGGSMTTSPREAWVLPARTALVVGALVAAGGVLTLTAGSLRGWMTV